jgi:DnaK suppressor protein
VNDEQACGGEAAKDTLLSELYLRLEERAGARYSGSYDTAAAAVRFQTWLASKTHSYLDPFEPNVSVALARKRLEEMREDLDRTVSVLQGEHHLLRGGSAEAGDAGTNLTESDRNATAVQAALAQRTEVLAALARIDEGSYGRCVDCYGPVPERRLEARPATERCVPCQSKRDRRRR